MVGGWMKDWAVGQELRNGRERRGIASWRIASPTFGGGNSDGRISGACGVRKNDRPFVAGRTLSDATGTRVGD